MEPPDRRNPRDGRYGPRSGGRPPQQPQQSRRSPRDDMRDDMRDDTRRDPTAPLPPLSATPDAQRSQYAPPGRPVWPSERDEPGARAAAPTRRPPQPAARTGAQPRRRRLSLGWVAVIVLLLVVIGIASYGVYTTRQAQRPYAAAQAFCADLQGKQYTAAYGLLSTAYRKTISLPTFTLTYELHDQVDGPISACSTPAPGSVIYTYSAPTALGVPAHITRKQALQGTLSLVEDGQTWHVSQVGASLQGTDVGPLLAQNTFCGDLIAGNYAAAYAQLAPGAQANGAEQDFATAYAHAFSGGVGGGLTLARCQPDLTTYTVANGDAQVKVMFVAQASGQTVNFPTQFTFIQTRGVWEIANVALRVVPIS